MYNGLMWATRTNGRSWSTAWARSIRLTVASTAFDPDNRACPASLSLHASDAAQQYALVQQGIDSSPPNPSSDRPLGICRTPSPPELPPCVPCSSTIVVSCAGPPAARRCHDVLFSRTPCQPNCHAAQGRCHAARPRRARTGPAALRRCRACRAVRLCSAPAAQGRNICCQAN